MSLECQEEETCEELGVCEESNDASKDVSSFIDLYKYSNRTASYSQEKRRELFLQKLKEKRCEAFDEKRHLLELFSDAPPELMECESARVWKVSKKFPFGYKLMGCEWVEEVPQDLAENWLIKLCPEGVRYLVVANQGVTTCYYKNGKVSRKFKSNLPGGHTENLSHRFTVLDCIFNKATNTFLVYDALAWNSMSLINAEAQMRFFWLKSKFEENPEYNKTWHPKNYKFVLVDFFPAQIALLQDQIFTPFKIDENELPIEGVLFYHKEGHYVSGNCPLVGWLKPFMLPEILHIDIPLNYTENKPENYENLQQYISCKKKKRRRNKKTDVPMLDVEEIDAEESIDCDN